MSYMLDESYWSDEQNQLIDANSIASDDTCDDCVEDYEQKYVSLSMSDHKIGAAVYHSISHCIEILEDLNENSDYCLVTSLLKQTEPSNVILSDTCDQTLLLLLNNYAIDSDVDHKHIDSDNNLQNAINTPIMTGDNTSPSVDESDSLWFIRKFRIHVISQQFYSYDCAKSRILKLNLSDSLNFSDNNEKSIYLSSILNFSCVNAIRSFGALLRFLDKYRVGVQLEHESITIPVSRISHLFLNNYVTLDRQTFDSLQIFHNEWHPSTFKQGMHKKEGFSLFGIFDRCVSKLGSYYMRRMFLRPTQDIDVINERLNAIEFFNDKRNSELKSYLNNHLKHIKNVETLMKRVDSKDFTVNNWKTIYKLVMNALVIRDIVKEQPVSLSLFHKITKEFTDKLVELANVLNTVIDFEASINSNRFQVKRGIDAELDDQKLTLNNLPDILSELARMELVHYNDVLSECSCVYIPQIGFLICVEKQRQHNITQTDLSLSFEAGNHRYYKNDYMKELDNHYGDIQSDINDRQLEIMHKLQDVMIDEKAIFDSVMRCCAELDCLISMSQTSLVYNYCRPCLTSDGTISILNGRHPLQELTSQSFVPNDYESSAEFMKVKIITGPNGCGKSVYLKQVAIIVYLAHIGSFVPATAASITIIDKLFTRIHSPESVSTQLSTFANDLNRMAKAIENSTIRSLVVVDEFGKGTQSVDGLSLFASCLRYWFVTNTPHLIVSTHFHSLTEFLSDFDYLYENQTFEVEQTSSQLVYNYRLVNGKTNDSVARNIAIIAGIPSNIIDRSSSISRLIATNKLLNRNYYEELDNKIGKYLTTSRRLIYLDIESEQILRHFLLSLD